VLHWLQLHLYSSLDTENIKTVGASSAVVTIFLSYWWSTSYRLQPCQ